MNKVRREQISTVVGKLKDCKDVLEEIKNDEDCSRENMPENLENSQRYTDSEEASDSLDDATSDIGNAIDTLEKITG